MPAKREDLRPIGPVGGLQRQRVIGGTQLHRPDVLEQDVDMLGLVQARPVVKEQL
jgi:hypothetical protein